MSNNKSICPAHCAHDAKFYRLNTDPRAADENKLGPMCWHEDEDGICGHRCPGQQEGEAAAIASQGERVQSAMSRPDYLLSHLAQECAEVIVRVTKAQHFGLDEIQPEQPYTNRERLYHEVCDLLGIIEILKDEGGMKGVSDG